MVRAREVASKSSVVFAIANANDLGAAKAILSGLKKRYEKTGEIPRRLANGLYATKTIYSDLNIPQIESLTPTRPHRDVDLVVVEAGRQGYVRSHIILPSMIYGLATGPLFDKGISNRRSVLLPV
ncbi:hypothetical protein JAAARDRAFT_200488 [Jaapia argillacea MUCL 33604]|uniref:Uncharacterized protein n=1 Tax=Jaapia argillacea MUCL 33604 TaxID=933084 RepID=A0A067PH98_9AGAM|nr:hypothetical protein JAAARDRAFT_200488 [Jaapia argillacea MUCL 33604]